MAKKKTFYGSGRFDGQINFDDFPAKKAHVIKHAEKRLKVTIELCPREKTPNQNAYFHGVVLPWFAKQCGYKHNFKPDIERIRDELKDKCGPKIKSSDLQGCHKMVPKSIADYTISDYQLLIDNCALLAHDYGLGQFPPPERIDHE